MPISFRQDSVWPSPRQTPCPPWSNEWQMETVLHSALFRLFTSQIIYITVDINDACLHFASPLTPKNGFRPDKTWTIGGGVVFSAPSCISRGRGYHMEDEEPDRRRGIQIEGDKIRRKTRKSDEKWGNLMEDKRIRWKTRKSDERWGNMMEDKRISWKTRKSDGRRENQMKDERIWWKKTELGWTRVNQMGHEGIKWNTIGWHERRGNPMEDLEII